jgi:hypothetical protein
VLLAHFQLLHQCPALQAPQLQSPHHALLLLLTHLLVLLQQVVEAAAVCQLQESPQLLHHLLLLSLLLHQQQLALLLQQAALQVAEPLQVAHLHALPLGELQQHLAVLRCLLAS